MKETGLQNASESVSDDQAVAAYLQQNPDFFIRQARQVEQMMVPHPVRGTVSLVEWLLARQRNQIAQLNEEITLLMNQATANHQLFDRLLLLQSQMASAPGLRDMLNLLHRWAREQGLAHADVRLFKDKWRIGAPSDFTRMELSAQAFESVRIRRLGKQLHYLGSLNGSELLLLLPQAKAVGSVAMSLMGEQGELGVLLFSSRDAQHFQPGMGTLLLQHLAQMIPELVSRWVERI